MATLGKPLGNLKKPISSGKRRLSGAQMFAVALAIIAVFPVVRAVRAQTSQSHVSMVIDWSHRHVIFSRPTSWVTSWKLQSETRYWQQGIRHSGIGPVFLTEAPREPELSGDVVVEESRREFGRDEDSNFKPRWGRIGGWPRRERLDEFHRDWGQSLGAGGSTGAPLSGVNWNPVFPAKFSFDINAKPDCVKDFVVFPTNLPGATAGQASIIAYNQLYSGTGTPFCAAANSSVYWAYNTNFDNAGAATTGTVATSPILSIDGRKLAFVENRATGGAILHLLLWHAGDGGAISTAAAPTHITTWTACPANTACLINLVFNNTNADTASSPWYDYVRDTLYVGDDKGVLHKFANVFGLGGATPSEVTTGWPITVDATATPGALTSPTVDTVTGNLFVTETTGTLSYIRETFSTAGTCKTGVVPCLGSTTILPTAQHVVPDAPIVDSTTGKVFIFFGNDGGGGASVVQSDITLSASIRASLGTGTGHHLHSGAFDNTYLTGNGSAGFLYTCGSSASSAPTIQRIGFTNTGRVPASPFANAVGTMNAAVGAATLAVATGSAECSPLTELFNSNAPAASQDQIFFGVQTLGSGTNCGGGGCVMSVNVTSPATTLSIAHSIAEIGGPSGITVDNVANTTTFPQASSLYFSNQGNSTAGNQCNAITGVGCAIKLTQSGLN